MTHSPFETIGLLGAGAMGSGIAQVCAQSGLRAVLCDPEARCLEAARHRIASALKARMEKGRLDASDYAPCCDRIDYRTDPGALIQCDLLIEAVPEDPNLKKKLFREMDALCPPETVFASNTSSISITLLGSATQRPERVAGLHFFNPAPVMRLVEVIRGERTADETMERLVAFARFLGKTPVEARDTPGFIVNRVARPFYGEALKILGENASDPTVAATIDTIMREAGGFRMGPFELMDFIGVDVNFAVTQSVWRSFFHLSRYRPHPIQQRMTHAGLLGRKTGEGFYRYDA